MIDIGENIVCIKTGSFSPSFMESFPNLPYERVIMPKVGKRYTVRGFFHYEKQNYLSIVLEEINNINFPNIELHFPIHWFEGTSVISLEKEKIEEELMLN